VYIKDTPANFNLFDQLNINLLIEICQHGHQTSFALQSICQCGQLPLPQLPTMDEHSRLKAALVECIHSLIPKVMGMSSTSGIGCQLWITGQALVPIANGTQEKNKRVLGTVAVNVSRLPSNLKYSSIFIWSFFSNFGTYKRHISNHCNKYTLLLPQLVLPTLQTRASYNPAIS
jgi:hypothetical protein